MKLKGLFPKETEAETSENKYIPGSSEKKRATVMYFFFGIIASLSKREFSPFEYYHLKQAIGLRILIMPLILLCLIPVLKWIGVLLILVVIVVLMLNCVNARNGKYFVDNKKVVFALFAGIGGWVLDLFDLGIKVQTDESLLNTDNLNKSNVDDLQFKDTSLQEDVQELENEELSNSTEESGGVESDVDQHEDLETKQDGEN